MYVVLVYDISLEDKGAKRWRSVFKICKKYLSHIQNSVFEGEISKPHIDKNLDSVIVFKSRQEKWLEKDFWGKDNDMTDFML